jgi:porin
MLRPSARPGSVWLSVLLLAHAAPVWAQEAPAGLLEQDTFTGTWGGFRTDLKDRGIAISATEIGEVLGASGGPRDGGMIYEGRLEFDIDVDVEKIVGITDMVIHANAYQIHGRGLSQNYLGANLLVASNIEAIRATRLFDLWAQKGFLDNALSIRLGQIAADDEFIVSQYAGIFVNATFGWPAIASANLPGGGPAYPLATPGLRIKNAFSEEFSLQAAVFGGNPAGTIASNPQISDASGTSFSLRGGSLIIAEGILTPQPENASPNWPSAYKIGIWYHTGAFDDQRYDRAGLSLASVQSSNLPLRHRGEFGAYAVVDQPLYRVGDSDDRGLAAFLRVGVAPGNQDIVAAYLDAGVDWKGPIDSRPDDMLGLAFGYAQTSGASQGFDKDLRRFGQVYGRIADFECAVELTYQASLAPWWSLQPDLQYDIHPTPTDGTVTQSEGAFVAGLRTSIKF